MKKFLTVFMAVSFGIMVYINFLSGTGRINGISAGGVSARYPTYFTPAGFTFSIWGIIYLTNLVFMIYAVVSVFSNKNDFPSIKISSLYIVSCFINMAWIFSWHYEAIVFCMVLMLLFLYTLSALYQSLTTRKLGSAFEYIATVVPVSLYVSWIVVATLANFSVMTVYLNWKIPGVPGHYIAVILVILAGIANIWVLLKKKDIFFSLVFLWAATGIIIARRHEANSASDTVAVTALVAMAVVFIMMVITRFLVIRQEKLP